MSLQIYRANPSRRLRHLGLPAEDLFRFGHLTRDTIELRESQRVEARDHEEGVGLEITSSPADVCIACHQPLPARDLTCPACGAVNSWRIRHGPMKRRRFLWRTGTLRNRAAQIHGHFLLAGGMTNGSIGRLISTQGPMTLQ